MIALQIQAEGGEDEPCPHQIVGEHFGAALVYDLPQSIMYVKQDQLDEWGVTLYEALEVARQNLAQMQHPFIGPKEGPGVYVSAARDGYDASRLVFLDLIRRFHVKGAPVAMIPNRDTLIVTGEDDADGLRAMLTLANDAKQQPRFMSAVALRLEGDEWEPWLPDEDHPLFAEFTSLRVESLGMAYNQQKDLLDKINERKGEDVYVGQFGSLEQPSTGRTLSWCVWSKGIPTLLPQTDLIGFHEEGREPALYPWQEVEQAVGDLMEPLDMYPPRYRVTEFPTAQQLDAMTPWKE